jgi:phage gpG-like protein
MASDDETTVELNMKGLEQLLKALKDKPPVGRIGVLGSSGKDARTNKSSNAEIGAAHEFGAPNASPPLPVRSFLRVPLSEMMQKELDQSNATDENVVKEVIKMGSVRPWMDIVAKLCEGIVGDAFDTGGFGKWKPSNMAFKKNRQTLVETQQLRNSITSEVK